MLEPLVTWLTASVAEKQTNHHQKRRRLSGAFDSPLNDFKKSFL